MFIRRVNRPSSGTVIGMIALVLAIAGGGYAAVGAAPQTPQQKTGARFYGANDYSPGDTRVGYQHEFVGQIVCTSSPLGDGPGTAFWLSFDNLPDGASITKITVYYVDTDEAEDLTFRPAVWVGGAPDELDEFTAATSTTGPGSPPAGVQSLTMTPTSPVPVDNANRRYLLLANFSSGACGNWGAGNPGLALDGVRVDFRRS